MNRKVRPLYRHALTLAVWMGVFGSIYGWSVRLTAEIEPVEPQKKQSAFSLPEDSTKVISQLLGNPSPAGQTSEMSLQTRFLLAGVIADESGRGAALIGVDGKVARPYAVGAELVPGVVLYGVRRHQVLITNGPDPAVSAILTMATVNTIDRGSRQNVYSPAEGQTTSQLSTAVLYAAPVKIPAGPPPRQDSRYRTIALPHH